MAKSVSIALRIFVSSLLLGSAVTEGTTCGETGDTCENQERSTDLYKDAANLLDISMHTYGYSCLRKLAQKFPNDFKRNETILSDKMKAIDLTDIVSFARENKATIKKLNETHSSEFSLESTGSLARLWNQTETPWKKGEVSFAIDTDEQEKELVYGIAVDRLNQRVIVSFRGSETFEDWIRNIGGNYKRLQNPHFEENGKQPKIIRLHTGFHDYLLKKRWFSDRDAKFDMIKAELAKVLKDNEGYPVFVTGHSLGGALSTIFSFYITSEKDIQIPDPVTLISFAAPLVGDEDWQRGFQLLEKSGTLRHLRVSNLEDYVPTVPISSPNPLDWGRDYKHTGIYLKLFDNNTHDLKHSYLMKTRATVDTKWVWETLPWHTLILFRSRLDSLVDKVEGRQLMDLYQDSEVLGAFATFEQQQQR